MLDCGKRGGGVGWIARPFSLNLLNQAYPFTCNNSDSLEVFVYDKECVVGRNVSLVSLQRWETSAGLRKAGGGVRCNARQFSLNLLNQAYSLTCHIPNGLKVFVYDKGCDVVSDVSGWSAKVRNGCWIVENEEASEGYNARMFPFTKPTKSSLSLRL